MICVSICEVVAYSFPLLCIHCGPSLSLLLALLVPGVLGMLLPLGTNSLFWAFQLSHLYRH